MLAMGILLLFIFLLYSFVLYPRVDQTDRDMATSTAKDICSDLSTAINRATYNGNGFSQPVGMPATINGAAYNVTVYAETIAISWPAGEAYCQFRAKNVSYAGKYPPMALNISRHIISNVDGVVKIA